MDGRLEKVAEELAGARAHFDELLKDQEEMRRRHAKALEAYKPHQPDWEAPAQLGLVGGGLGSGLVGGALLGRRFDVPRSVKSQIAMMSGSLGAMVGGVGATGVQTHLDRQDPERLELRTALDNETFNILLADQYKKKMNKQRRRHKDDPDRLEGELARLNEERKGRMQGTEKVAYDLQNAYDYYRGRVDHLNKSLADNEQAHADYKAHKPGWETPAMVAAPLIGAGLGAVGGHRLTKRYLKADDAIAAGTILGGTAGLMGGAIAGHGVERLNDRRDPERPAIRERMDHSFQESGRAMNDVHTMQDIIGRRGAEDPLAVYPMLQPGDEYDREIEDSIRGELEKARAEQTERSGLERELLRAHVERERAKAGHTDSKTALNINQIMQSQG